MTTIDNLNYRVLSAAVNKIQAAPTFLTDLFFSNRIPREAQTIDIDIIVGNTSLAPFVAPYQGAKVVKKLGRKQSTVKAPIIRNKKQLPASMFSEREAGTTVYINKEGRQAAQEKKIKMEQQDLKDRATRRIEWMCAQALTGSMIVEQEDVSFNIDFGLPDAHKPILEGQALWSDKVNSNPLKNIDEWKKLVNQATGQNVTDIVLGSRAESDFLSHPKVLEAYDKKNINVGQMDLNESNYLGTYRGMKIWSDSEQYQDDAGETKDMINPDACVLVAKSDDFELNFGAVEDLKAGGDVVTEFFSKMWEEHDPSAMWLLVETRPIPIPKRIESIVYAIVTEEPEEDEEA